MVLLTTFYYLTDCTVAAEAENIHTATSGLEADEAVGIRRPRCAAALKSSSEMLTRWPGSARMIHVASRRDVQRDSCDVTLAIRPAGSRASSGRRFRQSFWSTVRTVRNQTPHVPNLY